MRGTRTRKTRTMAVAAVATGLLAGGITTSTTDIFNHNDAPPADRISNASASGKSGRSCVAERQVRNVKFTRTIKVWPNKPGYVIAAWGPGQLRIDYKVETSNKVGGTFGLSKGAVSAAVGFDVTETIGRNFGYTAILRKHAHYKLRAGEVYKEYRFDVYDRLGEMATMGMFNFVCLPKGNTWVKAGTSTATKFWTTDHRLTKGCKAR